MTEGDASTPEAETAPAAPPPSSSTAPQGRPYPFPYCLVPNGEQSGEGGAGAPPPLTYSLPFSYPGYPPPPPGYMPVPLSGMPLPQALVKPKRKQVKMACTNCATACKRCDNNRPCERCTKYGLQDSCRDGVRKERKKGVKRGPYRRRNKGEGGEPQRPEDEWTPSASATTVAAPQFVQPPAGYPLLEGSYVPAFYIPPPPNEDGSQPFPPPHAQFVYPPLPPGAYPPFPFAGMIPPQPPPIPPAPGRENKKSKRQDEDDVVPDPPEPEEEDDLEDSPTPPPKARKRGRKSDEDGNFTMAGRPSNKVGSSGIVSTRRTKRAKDDESGTELVEESAVTVTTPVESVVPVGVGVDEDVSNIHPDLAEMSQPNENITKGITS